jgi:hypothetical protein
MDVGTIGSAGGGSSSSADDSDAASAAEGAGAGGAGAGAGADVDGTAAVTFDKQPCAGVGGFGVTRARHDERGAKTPW